MTKLDAILCSHVIRIAENVSPNFRVRTLNELLDIEDRAKFYSFYHSGKSKFRRFQPLREWRLSYKTYDAYMAYIISFSASRKVNTIKIKRLEKFESKC